MTAAFPTILAVLIGLTFEEFYAESALPTVSAWRLLLVLPACLLPILMAEAVLFAAGRRFDRQGARFYPRPRSRDHPPEGVVPRVVVVVRQAWPRPNISIQLSRAPPTRKGAAPRGPAHAPSRVGPFSRHSHARAPRRRGSDRRVVTDRQRDNPTNHDPPRR